MSAVGSGSKKPSQLPSTGERFNQFPLRKLWDPSAYSQRLRTGLRLKRPFQGLDCGCGAYSQRLRTGLWLKRLFQGLFYFQQTNPQTLVTEPYSRQSAQRFLKIRIYSGFYSSPAPTSIESYFGQE